MSTITRNVLAAAGITAAVAIPFAATAAHTFETTTDEAGSRIVHHFAGAIPAARSSDASLAKGDISADRLFVYLGDEGGWQLRPMEYQLRGGRLAHVDDPVGHMEALPDDAPASTAQRARLERGGS